jgi:hypothetical protein
VGHKFGEGIETRSKLKGIGHGKIISILITNYQLPITHYQLPITKSLSFSSASVFIVAIE